MTTGGREEAWRLDRLTLGSSTHNRRPLFILSTGITLKGLTVTARKIGESSRHTTPKVLKFRHIRKQAREGRKWKGPRR